MTLDLAVPTSAVTSSTKFLQARFKCLSETPDDETAGNQLQRRLEARIWIDYVRWFGLGSQLCKRKVLGLCGRR